MWRNIHEHRKYSTCLWLLVIPIYLFISKRYDQANQNFIQVSELRVTYQTTTLFLITMRESYNSRKNIPDRHLCLTESVNTTFLFVSKVFRFVDDVEFYFPDKNSNELLIHVRSASRIGYSDPGVNRKRIENIRKKIQKNQ